MSEYVPSSSDYPAEWQFALVVRGESLNRTARDGDRLVCLDLIKSMEPIRDNDLVVCERSLAEGQFVERTAKRVRKTINGYELWPDSNHPDHQDPVEYRVDGDPMFNEVRVIARVLWVLRKP